MRATRIALALLSVLFATQAFAETRVSQGRFTELFIDALRAEVPELDIRPLRPLQLTIARDGRAITVHLGNAFVRCETSPDMLHVIVDDHVVATIEQLGRDDLQIDVTRIVPVMENVRYREELASSQNGDGAELAHESYNETLIVLYAEDKPSITRFLDDRTLDDLRIDRSKLRSIAVRNLVKLLPELIEVRGANGVHWLSVDGTYKGSMSMVVSSDTTERGQSGIYRVSAGGNYEASLLLFDDIWSSDTWSTGDTRVAGEVVVAVPARDVLVVSGSRESEGIATLREIASGIVASDLSSLTEQLFVYRNGRFQPFEG